MSPRRLRDATWFEVLGIAPTASEIEIAAAYRRCAKAVHPDTAPASDPETRRAREAEMARVNEAYREARDAAAARVAAAAHAANDRRRPVEGQRPSDPEAASSHPSEPTESGTPDVAPTDSTPRETVVAPIGRRRWGWRMTSVFLVAALTVVVFLARSTPAPRDPVVDTCVIWAGGYHPTPCDQPHAGRIVEAVDRASECPSRSAYMHTSAPARVLCIDTSG
jgi:hypothetical protein